jgi:hypothetical protein
MPSYRRQMKLAGLGQGSGERYGHHREVEDSSWLPRSNGKQENRSGRTVTPGE